ncbi:MAG: GAF domain-containing protein [Chloroflexi bacterium]|nr:GAF domain-containing protein [Chloroflexota bacterium]
MNEEKIHILLVEDNPNDAMLAQRALEQAGHSITWAADGEKAMTALQQTPFDLLLLDYRLPKTDGLEILARLREDGHTLPVIMVTGESDQRIAAEALKAGAADYIVKEKGYLGALPRTASQVVHTHRLTVARAAHQQLNQALSGTLDLPTIYRTLYECLRQHLDCTNFAVARFNEETRVFTCTFAISDGEPVAPEIFPPRPADFPPLSKVLQSGQPLIITDLLTSPDLAGPGGQKVERVGPGAPARSAIYAPLLGQDRPLGILLLQSPLPHAYRQADAEMLLTVASQAAMRIQNADLYTRATRREEQVRLAAEVGREISAILDEPLLLERVVTLIQEQFNLYNVNIFMRVGNQMECKAGHGGYNGDPPIGIHLSIGQGIIGTVAQTGESLNVPDVLQDERYYHYEKLPDVRSELAVPLRLHDHVAGALDVQSCQPAAFDDIDQLVMQMVADQVGVALQNARAHQAMTLQGRKLAALNQVIAAAATGLDVQTVLEQSLDAALDALSLEGGSLFITDDRGTITHVAVRGHTDTFLERISAAVPRERGFRATVVVENLDEFDSPLGPLLSAEKIRAFIGVPIRIGETIGGGLTGVASKPRHFTPAEIQLLESVGRQVGVAVERAQVFEAKQAALRREETLRNVLAIASTSLDPHIVLQRVIELACESLGADWGESHIPLPEGGHHTLFAGIDTATCDVTATPCLSGVNGVALFDNEVVCLEKVSEHPKSVGFPENHITVGPFLGVPVRIDDKPVADLLLARQKGREPFTAEDEALLVAIADQAALALRNARLFEQTNRQITGHVARPGAGPKPRSRPRGHSLPHSRSRRAGYEHRQPVRGPL